NNTMEVVRLSVEEIRQLYEVREVLDGLAARLLAERRLSYEQTEELRSCLEIMQASSNPYDGTRYGPAHARFHCGICEACGNKRLQSYQSVIRLSSQSLTRRLMALSSEAASEQEREFLHVALAEAERDHRAIFELIAAGDARAAEVAARRHIRRTVR